MKAATPLELYLLRHSNAVERAPHGGGDAQRPLTKEGAAKALVIGRALVALGLKFDLVLSSPAVRARETAQQVLRAFRPLPPLELLDALQIGGDPAVVIHRLADGRKRPRSVLLVGHEPDLGLLAARLTSGAGGLGITFKKGGLAKLSVSRLRPGRCATLEWLLTPKHLRLLARK